VAVSYRRLFADALVGRDRTVAGIRFRFRADDGIGARVRHLAHLEEQCCSFFTLTITVTGGEVLWDSTVIDDDTGRACPRVVLADEVPRSSLQWGKHADGRSKCCAGAPGAFIGEWTMEASFPVASPTGIVGRTVFEWVLGGQFLVQRSASGSGRQERSSFFPSVMPRARG
jgi:hypothetical protein